MYKKQMTLQKIVCLLAIIAGALVFIYSLGLLTDVYDCMYTTMRDPSDLTKTKVPGSIIYYDMQDFNNALLKIGIGLILLSCLLFLTNTHSRRKYYIGNYTATVLMAGADIAAAVWVHQQVTAFRTQWLTTVDFAKLEQFAEKNKTLYTQSTFWFDLHYAVFAVVLLSAALLIINAVWKSRLIKSEQALIEAGRSV